MRITAPSTAIPNDVMELLMSEALNDTERRILLFIARKTYGFGKTEDKISNSQFELALNLAHSTVSTALNRLKLVGIIILVQPGSSKKNPNLWRLDISDIAKKLVGITKLVRYDKKKLVGITIHTKESITKERERREHYPIEEPTESVLTSKNSFTPCTDVELWTVANDLEIPLTDVKEKHAQILELVETGEMKSRYSKNKTTYNTLRTWLRGAIAKGYIQKLDELGKDCLQQEHPERKKEAKELIKYATEHGIL